LILEVILNFFFFGVCFNEDRLLLKFDWNHFSTIIIFIISSLTIAFRLTMLALTTITAYFAISCGWLRLCWCTYTYNLQIPISRNVIESVIKLSCRNTYKDISILSFSLLYSAILRCFPINCEVGTMIHWKCSKRTNHTLICFSDNCMLVCACTTCNYNSVTTNIFQTEEIHCSLAWYSIAILNWNRWNHAIKVGNYFDLYIAIGIHLRYTHWRYCACFAHHVNNVCLRGTGAEGEELVICWDVGEGVGGLDCSWGVVY